MPTLKLVPGGLSLVLTAVTTPAGDAVDLYDDPAMVVTTVSPPVTGNEITLPLAFSTDTTLYGHDGPVVLTITQANGRAVYSDQVDLSSGNGTSVTTVAPVLDLAQVAAEVIAPGFPAYATASRPDPTAVPAGSAIFDTDLKAPLWSDGTAWLLATGLAPA